MITPKTYRYMTATFLLILYVFICLPAHVWHHHENDFFPDKGSSASDDLTIIKKAADAPQEDCAVCAHQYSGYSNDSCIPLVAVATDIPFLNGYCIFSYPPAFCVQSSNKGPPHLPDLTGFQNQ